MKPAVVRREDLDSLPPAGKRETMASVISELHDRYRSDFWAWLTEQVWTHDDAARQKERWPSERDKPYLKDVAAILASDEPKVALPKSRRMMATWEVAAFATWSARYFENQSIFWQSEKEAKAAYVVDRYCAYIENHLDTEELRRPYVSHKTHEGLIGRIQYVGGSHIWAIEQGADAIRTYTPSLVVMDESDFQEKGQESLDAVNATVEKLARVILISSSNGPRGVMAGICKAAGFIRWSG